MDIYVFDFDGVVVESEKYHWMAYDAGVSFEEYCRINHSLTGPYFRETMDAAKKDATYKEYIKDIPLKEGFEEFYNKLKKAGNKIYIVTNSSQEIFDIFTEKFPFLKDIPVITGCNKPDPSGYMAIPQEGRTIVFEDSYRGFYAASQVFSNVVLVNTSDYVYFDTIDPEISIENFRGLEM